MARHLTVPVLVIEHLRGGVSICIFFVAVRFHCHLFDLAALLLEPSVQAVVLLLHFDAVVQQNSNSHDWRSLRWPRPGTHRAARGTRVKAAREPQRAESLTRS